jgi:type IV secretory pathway VirB6-like protein
MNRVMIQIARLRGVLIPLMLAAWMVSSISPAYATSATGTVTADNCTNFQERFSQTNDPSSGSANNQGLLSQIYLFIKDIVDDATKKIFENFTKNAGYKQAVYAATVLSVILFGVFFTIGLVQLSAGQLLVRLLKIAIIFTVISPSGWTFFSENVVRFFNDGTDELVTGILQIAAGGVPAPPGSTPFYQLDKLGEFLINPETLIAILGSLTTGPFGLGMGALLGLAFGAFLKMLIEALRIYAVSFVVRSLLLGLAPIFIVFLLFEKTKQLFSTWLNSLVSTALQPILLFLFLAFFVVMLESATKNMFNTELCYVEFAQGTGSTNRISGWRFLDPATNEAMTGEDTWQGPLACLLRDNGATAGSASAITGSSGEDCPEFPIKILDVLSFLMLVFLASRFAEVIDRVANELSSTFIALDPAGRMDQFMSQRTPGTQPPPAAPRTPPPTPPR